MRRMHRISITSFFQITHQYKIEDVLKHPKWADFVQQTGRVVCILEEKHKRVAAGHLALFGDRNQNYAQFQTLDKRVPYMKIPMAQCPENFYFRSGDFKETLFLAEIVKWEQPNSAMGEEIKRLESLLSLASKSDRSLSTYGLGKAENFSFRSVVRRSFEVRKFTLPTIYS